MVTLYFESPLILIAISNFVTMSTNSVTLQLSTDSANPNPTNTLMRVGLKE